MGKCYHTTDVVKEQQATKVTVLCWHESMYSHMNIHLHIFTQVWVNTCF